MKRPALVAAIVTVFVTGAAAPARADSAAPTNYRSEVTEVDPPQPQVEVEVIGGDSFLQIDAEPGTEVEVPGYQGEPFLKFSADGAVLANHNSPSFWINQDRFAQAAVPAGASAEAVADWQQISSGGRHGWHDHRIHWMSPEPPPAVDRASRSLVQEWAVPMVVDGQQTTVTGVLEWVPRISPLPWLLLMAVAAAVVAWAGMTGWVMVVGSGVATIVGLAQAMSSPLGLLGEVLVWVPPAIALILGGIALAWIRTRLAAVAAVVLAVWVGLRLATLWMPVLPGPFPAALERAAVALAGGIALGVLIPIYRRLAPSATKA